MKGLARQRVEPTGPTPRSRRGRRPAVFVLASALLHLVAILLLEWLGPPDLERHILRPARPFLRPFAIERFHSRPAVLVTRQVLERVRAEGVPLPLAPATDGAPPRPLPDIEVPTIEASPTQIATRVWEAEQDTVRDSVLYRDQAVDLPSPDLVELDAERRRRNIALIDPETGKLIRAWLHLACYRSAPPPRLGSPESECPGCPGFEGGRDLSEAARMISLGFHLRKPVPIETEVHWQRIGPCIRWPAPPIEGQDPLDPIHRFGCRPRRRLLYPGQLAHLSILHLLYVDVASTDTLVNYLADGGFALMTGRQLSVCHDAMARRFGERVERVTL